jgi:hypothetical protein
MSSIPAGSLLQQHWCFFVLDDEGAFAIAWPALPLERFDTITQQVAWTIRRSKALASWSSPAAW